MTKKEMIKSIQVSEAKAFLTLKQKTNQFGDDHVITKRSRTEWITVNELMESLGITHDATLPESREALELIYKERAS